MDEEVEASANPDIHYKEEIGNLEDSTKQPDKVNYGIE